MMHVFKNRQYITLRKGLSWRTCQVLSQFLQLLVACNAGPQKRKFITIIVREKKHLVRCRCYNINRGDNLFSVARTQFTNFSWQLLKESQLSVKNLIVSQLTVNALANSQLSGNPIHTLWSGVSRDQPTSSVLQCLTEFTYKELWTAREI